MRKLIILQSEILVRDFLSAGAFDAISDDETFFLLGPGVTSVDAVRARPGFAGIVDMAKERRDAYGDIRRLMLTSYRRRSRTQSVKLGQLPWRSRQREKLAAAPGLRQLRIRRHLHRLGLHQELLEKMRELRPDLVIVPSSGIDAMIVDATRCARELGITVLGVMYNWDNLSSKAAFAVEPDYLGLVGIQSAEHAESIHGIGRERVEVIGSPYIDLHFHHEAGSAPSPHAFPYVLFAGCYQPFDELSALRRLEDVIEREGLDLKVVYLPHPRRLGRDVDDFVDDQTFRHVIVEPRVREGYVEDHGLPKGRMFPLPLDYYPGLLENARFVVCPLSTLMLEAAIFRRRVLVIAYHDGVHAASPGVAIDYLHFEGVDDVDTFEVCREAGDLAPLFARMAASGAPDRRPAKEQMDRWVFHDERPFGERLAAFVERIAARERLGAQAGRRAATANTVK